MIERPEALPRGTRVRMKADGREGYVYLRGGNWTFSANRWVGNYNYVFCSEEQPEDFDETQPPEGCIDVPDQMVELV